MEGLRSPCGRETLPLLLATALLAACAGKDAPATVPAASPTAAPPAEGAQRPGVPPPRFKPGASSPEPMPITSNAYGAYKGAPNAPRLGDIASDFELPLIDGGTFSLAEARASGPVLVMFYRGFW
jgi:hypothetical protein